MTQSTEGCRWVLCWHSSKRIHHEMTITTPINSGIKKEAQLLMHCNFTKTWSNLQQGVSNKHYMFRVCVQPYLYSMPSTCTVLHYNMWPVWLHFSTLFHKRAEFSETCTETKMCVDFLYRKKCSIRMETDRMKLIVDFHNFAEGPNSYNTHIP
jgi:hypothetical protein